MCVSMHVYMVSSGVMDFFWLYRLSKATLVDDSPLLIQLTNYVPQSVPQLGPLRWHWNRSQLHWTHYRWLGPSRQSCSRGDVRPAVIAGSSSQLHCTVGDVELLYHSPVDGWVRTEERRGKGRGGEGAEEISSLYSSFEYMHVAPLCSPNVHCRMISLHVPCYRQLQLHVMECMPWVAGLHSTCTMTCIRYYLLHKGLLKVFLVLIGWSHKSGCFNVKCDFSSLLLWQHYLAIQSISLCIVVTTAYWFFCMPSPMCEHPTGSVVPQSSLLFQTSIPLYCVCWRTVLNLLSTLLCWELFQTGLPLRWHWFKFTDSKFWLLTH